MDSEKMAEWAEMLRAVAHPTRLMILADLLKGMKCVGEIRELLEVPQPNISRHLTVLKHSGLVAFLRDGAFRCYYVPRPALVEALFRFLGRDYPRVSRPKGGKQRVGETGVGPAGRRSKKSRVH